MNNGEEAKLILLGKKEKCSRCNNKAEGEVIGGCCYE